MKTRKSPRKLPEYAATMHGLNEWYESKFEKLGWMVLAKAKGRDSKINEYKKSIKYLLNTIEHVMSEYQDPDRKHDLAVLHMNVMCLQDYVMKTL